MFDIGFWEIAVIGAIMLVVLGPERLPGVARTAGFWLSKIRSMVSDVKREVKREMDAAELKELEDAKNQIQEASMDVHRQMNENIVPDSKNAETKSAIKTQKDTRDGENLSVSGPTPQQSDVSEKTEDGPGRS